MKPHLEIPAIRTAERRRLISQLQSQLENDVRVRTAWLSGSIARGDDDWLSDIDLHVVVTDESIAGIIDNRHSFAAVDAKPTLSMDMMKNAAPNGAYLLVHYSGEFGPQHVDWYWVPESGSNRPNDGYLLFDRADIPVVDGLAWANSVNQTDNRPAIDSREPIDLANHKLEFFWAMTLIVSKYIVREDRATVSHMLGLIARTLDEIRGFLDMALDSTAADIDTTGFDTSRLFQALDSITQDAITLHDQVAGRGVSIAPEAITQVTEFINACKSVSLK